MKQYTEQQIKRFEEFEKDFNRIKNKLNIHERMFKKLNKILCGKLENLDSWSFLRLKSGGFMDLSVDNLGNGRIAIAHNFIQNGDVMADPDMELRINTEFKTVEALTYQLDSLSIFQEVYPEPGMINPRLKKELNTFLNQWLTNLKNQGHKITEVKK